MTSAIRRQVSDQSGPKLVCDRRHCRSRRPRLLLGVSRQISDVDFVGDFDRIIDFNAKIANRALNLGMPQQELDGSTVPCAPVDQHSIGSAQGVRAKLGRIEPDAGHPFPDEPGIPRPWQP